MLLRAARSTLASSAPASPLRRLATNLAANGASVVRESAAAPVIAAERLLRNALAEDPDQAALPLPIVLSYSTAVGGVRVVVSTLPECDPARTLTDALMDSCQWRLDAASEIFHAANDFDELRQYSADFSSEVESATLRLRIPHTLEQVSTPETPMTARPRLEQGSLTFEAAWLSIRMARALAMAARSAAAAAGADGGASGGAAASDGGAGLAAGTGGGPLLALDALVRSLAKGPLPSTATTTLAASASSAAPTPSAASAATAAAAASDTVAHPGTGKPFHNEAALKASAAHAATFPEMKLPASSASGSSAGAAQGGKALDRAHSPASRAEAIELIHELGARVLQPSGGAVRADGWAALAGSESVRRAVDEALLMPLLRPAAFASVLRATRAAATPPAARPTALLFHGPPGTGKTHAARIAAEVAGLPLVAAPLESLISKWYGEGEQKLAALFARCEALGRCVLFLDELDALAGSRSREMHEASRRMLSVLLRHLDGFDAVRSVALVGATNRPADLDAALLSRFDVRVAFPPPDAAARALVFGRYAAQLDASERRALAAAADGLSGRDILDACKSAERRWVYERLFRDDHHLEAEEPLDLELPPPPMRLYEESVRERREAVGGGEDRGSRSAARTAAHRRRRPRSGL